MNAAAQNYYKILEVRYDYSAPSSYEKHPENTVSIDESALSLNVPIPRKNGDSYLFGIGLNTMKMNPYYPGGTPSSDTAFSHNHMYYRYRGQLGYNKKISDKKSVVFMGMARLSSDMEEVDRDHYQYGGLVLFTDKKSDIFQLKYGLYVNTEFFGPFVIPLLGMDWKYSESVRIFGVLPASLTIEKTFNSRFRAGLMFEAPTETYRVSPINVEESGNGNNISTYVQNTKNVLFIYGEIYLTKSIVLQARAGYTIFRRVRLYDSDDVNTVNIYGMGFGGQRIPIQDVPAYQPFYDGFVLNANISYRFKLE